MKNSLDEKYHTFEDEKLFSILTSKKDEYQIEALETAERVLTSRGHKIDLKQMYTEKFVDFFDEDLISIAKHNKENYSDIAIEVVENMLEQRGFQLEAREVKVEKKTNYKPLLVGIILIVLNFYFAGVIYEYNITGRGSGFLINNLSTYGLMLDVLFRVITIGLIIYYRQKQEGKYLIIWIILGLFFGAWILIIVGILELITDYTTTNTSV